MRERAEIINLLREWLTKNGILVALFDLDDTLLDTNSLVTRKIQEYVSFVASAIPELDPKEILENIVRINDSFYESLAVRKEKMSAVAKSLGQMYGERNSHVFENGAIILNQIYTSVPDILPGAKDALETFRSAGISMGLVTHAEEPWTKLKLKAHNLEAYFDHIKIVNEKIHKAPSHWRAAVKSFGVLPDQVLIVGDNLRGDIMAASKIGARAAWVQPKWSVYAVGNEPEGTIKVESVGKLIETLITKV